MTSYPGDMGHVVTIGKYDSCPNYKHYNKDTRLQTTDIVISYSVLHAMNIKQPPLVRTYSGSVYNARGK